jgi:hypothetical protein
VLCFAGTTATPREVEEDGKGTEDNTVLLLLLPLLLLLL